MTDDKKFDLILFGASGFTGKLVAEYLVGSYSELNWAMAGRNEDKLMSVNDDLGADIPIVVLDSSKPDDIDNALSQTRLVLTTVGPYQLYGNEILGKCAQMGVHYVDLSGEPGWMHAMQKHLDEAKQSGARIVHSCGFDSVPSDMGVYYLQNLAKEKFGKPIQQVKCRVRSMKGEFSGGTAASFRATMGALSENPDLFNVLINPFALCEGFNGPEQPVDNKVYYDEVLEEWVAPFVMAAINTKNVHRSNMMLGHPYGEDFIYDEMMVGGSGDEGKAIAEAIASHNPMAGDNVPKPGEGPSKEVRDSGSYDMLFAGVEDGAVKIKVSVKGEGDPGYASTSKMIAESALCLLFDCPDLPGGIYTTAPAMGDKLIERLEKNSVMFFKEES